MTEHNGDLPAAAALFEAANKLRGSVESAEYKHLVLGLVFLKYVSDSFERRRQQLEALTRDSGSDYFVEADDDREEILEDRDEYTAQNVFWVPADARWPALLAKASQPDVGVVLDRALDEIERENEDLRGVLPKVYARAALAPEKIAIRGPRSRSTLSSVIPRCPAISRTSVRGSSVAMAASLSSRRIVRGPPRSTRSLATRAR